MIKVAIFTEGQSELIFVRELLLRLVDTSGMWLQCLELLSHQLSDVEFEHRCVEPKIFFLLVDVHGDEGVLSSIKEREINLVEKGGYERIIGLRDMYCEQYVKKSPGKIDDRVSAMIIENCELVVQNMRYNDKIKVLFAVMELEAWFLAMYNLLKRIHSLLTVDYIKNHTGIDLKDKDPERAFYRPSQEMKIVFNLCEMQYKKKKNEIENIARNMAARDLADARENGRCEHLGKFLEEIRGIASRYLYGQP